MKRRSQFVVAVLALAPLLAVAQVPARSARLPRRPASRTTVQQIEAMEPSLARHAPSSSLEESPTFPASCRSPGQPSRRCKSPSPSTTASAVRRRAQEFHLLEWPGRWQAGERYRIGERYLLFLHAPNAAGLTSPVGGSAGRFLIDSKGTIDISSIAPPSAERNIPASASSPVSDPPQRPPQPRTALPQQGPPYAHPQVRPE